MPIRHSEVEAAPRPGASYRCHVCRLELVLDLQTNKLAVVPFKTDPGTPPPRVPSDT